MDALDIPAPPLNDVPAPPVDVALPVVALPNGVEADTATNSAAGDASTSGDASSSSSPADGSVPAPPADAVPPAPVANTLTIGTPVVFSYIDGAGDTVRQYGVIVGTNETGHQLAWFTGLSGSIPESELRAL